MKIFSLAALLLFSAMVIAAPVAPAKNAEPLQLTLIASDASDYWLVGRAGADQAGRDFAVDVEFKTPSQAILSEQSQLADDQLARGVVGMALCPIDPENQTAMLNRIAQKTLLFTLDYDAPQSHRICYVGVDNVAAGRQAGQQLRRVLPNGGEVMVFVGRAEATNAAERWRGLTEALIGSQIRILDIRADGADRVKARQNVAEALVQHPHLAACVGLWSYHGPAILQALTTAKRLGKTKIVCFDEEEETLQGVARGQISATIVAQPYEIGYQTVALMTKYLRGNRAVVPANGRVFVPTLAITKSNVAPFQAQLRAWANAR